MVVSFLLPVRSERHGALDAGGAADLHRRGRGPGNRSRCRRAPAHRRGTSTVSLDEVRAAWETNVFGVLAVYQAMLPCLRESPDARIVNASSGVGSLTANADPAFPYHALFGPVYPASKAARDQPGDRQGAAGRGGAVVGQGTVRAAGPGSRHPAARPGRPRPGPGRAGAGPGQPAPHARHRGVHRPSARAGRVGGVFRGQRAAGQRDQARRPVRRLDRPPALGRDAADWRGR